MLTLSSNTISRYIKNYFDTFNIVKHKKIAVITGRRLKNVAFKKLYSVYIGRKLARDIISTTQLSWWGAEWDSHTPAVAGAMQNDQRAFLLLLLRCKERRQTLQHIVYGTRVSDSSIYAILKKCLLSLFRRWRVEKCLPEMKQLHPFVLVLRH